MNTPHTPGPWETASSSTADNRIIWDVCLPDGGDMIADLAECGDEQTQEANARLIAAAPEMLSYLQWIERVAHDSKKWALRNLAREAIAKATGQTP